MRALWDTEPDGSGWLAPDAPSEKLFRQAERNARQASEAFYRCRRFVEGWLAHADPKSGLIPPQPQRRPRPPGIAATPPPTIILHGCDLRLHRPSLVRGRMLGMLRAEIRLTSRLDRLGDDFLFSKQAFARPTINLDAIIFDNSEA